MKAGINKTEQMRVNRVPDNEGRPSGFTGWHKNSQTQKNVSAHTKNGPVCRLSHSPNSLISQNCPITPKPIYIFWYGYSVLVNTACDTVCLWLRDKARLFRCTSWWVLLVCSGIPVGGYCLSVQAYQLVGTACLFRCTSWWVLPISWHLCRCTTMPIDVHQLKGMAGQGWVRGECHPTQPYLLTYTR